MFKPLPYTKILFAFIFLFIMDLTYGSFTGKIDSHKNKYSLKNLASLNRTYVLPPFHLNTFTYKGSLNISQQTFTSGFSIQSMIRLEKGNTTYVYPYKYTVKVPKFITPSAPIIH